MNNNLKGLSLVLSSSLCYALTGIISKVLLNAGSNPLLTVFIRNAGGALALGLIVLIMNKKMLKIEKQDIKTVIIAGIVMFIYSAGYFFSLVYLDISIAIILLYTYPSMIVVASIFIFKEPITKIIAIALGLTFFGIILTLNLFTGTIGEISPFGIILALGAGVGAAAYAISIKGLSSKYSSFTISFYSFVASVIGYSIMLFIQPPQSIPAPVEILKILIMVIPYTLAFVFYAQGLRRLTPGQTGIAASTEPVFGLILAAIFLGEILSFSQILGGISIVTAVILLQIFPPKPKPKHTTTT